MNKQCTYIYPDNNWENKTLNYDLTQFDWPKWVLETIQEIEPNVTDLTKIHEVLSIDRIVKVQLHVQNSFSRREYAKRFDAFAETYIKPLIDNQLYLLKRQATLNLVVPNQEKLARRLPFHQAEYYQQLTSAVHDSWSTVRFLLILFVCIEIRMRWIAIFLQTYPLALFPLD
jgi:hypothetical protein